MSSRVIHKKDKNPYMVTNSSSSECYMTLDKLPTQRATVLSQEPLFQQHSHSQPKNKDISFVNIDPKNVIVLPMEKHQLTVHKHDVESSTDASHLPTPLDNKQINEHEVVLDNSANNIPKYNSVHDTLICPLWNISVAESGLTENEKNVMYEVSKNVKNFCNHFVKKLIYECAFKDGSFVKHTTYELTSILDQERTWCHVINVTGTQNMNCRWKNLRDTAHALLRSVTHMHPVIIRCLFREFPFKKTLSEKQELLRMCLMAEIYFYRDKMNNWDHRFYKYILDCDRVCTQIVYTLDRLGQNIVLMEWMSDWTGLFYFCQYEHGPFYHLLHPVRKEKGMSLCTYTNIQKQQVSCRDSILALENLTHEDYLTIIKNSWYGSHDNFTYVDVSDKQVAKLKKVRLSFEKYLLMTQQAFFKFEGEMRKNSSVKMFDDPHFPILTRACEIISGSYWKNLMNTVPIYGYFGEIFVNIIPSAIFVRKSHSAQKRDKEIKLMRISALDLTLPNKVNPLVKISRTSFEHGLEKKTVVNPYILQVGIEDDIHLFENEENSIFRELQDLKFIPNPEQKIKISNWIEQVKQSFYYDISLLEHQLNSNLETSTLQLRRELQKLEKYRERHNEQSNDEKIRKIQINIDEIEESIFRDLRTKVDELIDTYESTNSIERLNEKEIHTTSEETKNLNDLKVENMLEDSDITFWDMDLVENELPQNKRRQSLLLVEAENGVLVHNQLSEAILNSTDITSTSKVPSAWTKKISLTPAPEQDESSYKFMPPEPTFITYKPKPVPKVQDEKRSEKMYKCWGCDETFDELGDLKEHLEDLRKTTVQDKEILIHNAKLEYNKKLDKLRKAIEEGKKNFGVLLYQEEIEDLNYNYEREIEKLLALPVMKIAHQNTRRRYIDTIHLEGLINNKILEKRDEWEIKFNNISSIINNLNSIYTEIIHYAEEEERYGEQYGTTLRILFQEWKEEFKKGQAFITNKKGDFALKKILPEWVSNSDMKIMFENLKLKRAEILQIIADLKPTQNVETFFQLFLSSNTEPPCWLTVKNMLSLEDIYKKQGKRDGSSHNHIREMEFDEASWYADRNEKEDRKEEKRENSDHCPKET
jgi:hypothetical protein